MTATVFVSPLVALDSRLELLGPGTVRRWDPAWLHTPPEQVIAQIAQADPHIVVIGPGVAEPVAVGLIGAIERHRSDLAVVLVADPHSELLLHALRAGVADVIPPTVTQADLLAAITRARELVQRRRERPGPSASPTHRVVAVLSPKGGTGKTMIATALAVALAEHDQSEVGLLDLDVQFGDVASALGLLTEHTLGDAASAARIGLDATTLKVFLSRHKAGTYVLASPASLVEAEGVDVEHTKAVLHHFADLFDWTIVDTAGGIGEHTLVTLEFATDLLFVTTPEVAAVRGLRRSIEALEMVGMLNAERRLVVNQFEGRGSLSREEIEHLVGIPVEVTIPPSPMVRAAMDSGRAVLEGPAKDPAVRALRELVEVFRPEPGEAVKNGRFRKARRT